MPIPVRCECGKRTTVGDPLAGKTIRCPACGSELYVPTGAATTAQITQARKTAAAGSAIQMSGGSAILISVVAVVGIVLLLLFLGPVRVRHEWTALGSKPEDTVQNVVDFALKAYASHSGGYNPRRPHNAPGVIGAGVDGPWFAFSMPDKVPCGGTTNQGKFLGYYHPKTGEVEIYRLEVGGYSYDGMVMLGKPSGFIKVAGRIGPDGQPQAEEVTSGTPRKLSIYFPPASSDE